MDLNKKLDFAKMAVTSISRHDDEPASVRHHALDQLEVFLKTEREEIEARLAARLEEVFPSKK